MANGEVQVRAMYDFSGEPGSAELSITAGEILTVTRHDVGEGWWEGTNVRGQTGLFPAAYVEELNSSSQPPSIPPPPLPDGFSDWGGPQQSSESHMSHGDAPPRVSQLYDKSNDASKSYEGGSQSCESASHGGGYEAGDYWEDDDWDDDPENSALAGQTAANVPSHGGTSYTRTGSTDDDVSIAGSTRSVVPRKNFNRFSPFGKSGLENFLLTQTSIEVPASEFIIITINGYEISWDPITEPYSCVVASPKKESKLKGLKSFIAYQITPSFNNIQVSRRYKHFDWLHERLMEKFCLIPIPPLPDKQISGRYEEQFIEHRRVQLQAFVDAICRHPVLSRCSVWQHFISCTDEKRWKLGKRKEEKDRLLGLNCLFALQVPEQPLDLAYVEQEIDNFTKFIHSMDGAVKSLIALSFDQTKKHQGPYKREYQKIGQTFTALGLALQDATPSSESSITVITKAVKYSGDSYCHIAKLFEDQPKLDWEPLADILHKYKGILSSLPDIVTIGKTAIQKRRDCEKLYSENKMDEYQLNEVKRRADLVCYALVAEIRHFHRQLDDYDVFVGNFVAEQIAFYEKIGSKLREAWEMYKLPQGRPG